MRNRILLWSSIVVVMSACGGKDNHPPTAAAQSLTGTEDTAITGTAQGTDPDNDPLTYSVASQPAHGTVTVQASGAFQYQPAANYNGSDSFVFRVTDPSGATARATVTLTLTAVNDAPVLAAMTFDGVQNNSVTGKITGTDVDGDTLSYAVVSNPTHGTLVSLDAQGNFNYQPSAGYYGTDSFSVSVKDPSGATATGVITVKVDGPPQAKNDIIAVAASDAPVVDVLANDTDPDGDALAVQITTAPTTGTATVTADNRVSLGLPAGFRGFTRFNYRATDPSGLSSTATAVVFVGTPATRIAWIGDEFTPGARNIVVTDLLQTWAADSPLTVGDSLSPFSVLYRTQSDQPAVGFQTTSGMGYWAALDKPNSAQLIANSASITDIDVHNKYALYTTAGTYTLSLASLDGSPGYGALNPPNYCGGMFGPTGTDVFLGCTGPTNSFPLPTYYWLQLAAPGAPSQLAPPIQANGGPNAPFVTPDGSAIVYEATRTDSGGTFHALFLTKVNSPAQEVQITPRLTSLNEHAGGSFRVTPDGKKLIFANFSTSGQGIDIFAYDLVNGGLPVVISSPNGGGSLPLAYDISPDSQRIVYALPPVGHPIQLAVYETALATPGVASLVLPGVDYYGYYWLQYDETGTNIIYLGVAGQMTPTPSQSIYEWHRSDGSIVPLSPAADWVESFSHSDDWSIIAYAAKRSGVFVDDLRLLNRAVPGQALQLSNPAATTGVLTTNGNSAYFITK
jgi:VCBS repeat-containing protein